MFFEAGLVDSIDKVEQFKFHEDGSALYKSETELPS
jgi:hypothetical protein